MVLSEKNGIGGQTHVETFSILRCVHWLNSDIPLSRILAGSSCSDSQHPAVLIPFRLS